MVLSACTIIYQKKKDSQGETSRPRSNRSDLLTVLILTMLIILPKTYIQVKRNFIGLFLGFMG